MEMVDGLKGRSRKYKILPRMNYGTKKKRRSKNKVKGKYLKAEEEEEVELMR